MTRRTVLLLTISCCSSLRYLVRANDVSVSRVEDNEEDVNFSPPLARTELSRQHEPRQQLLRHSPVISKNNTTTQHCTDWKDCDSCNAARWCHWCGATKGCHVQGSAYGCARGETCHSPNTNDTCLAHTSCADCSLHSTLCHWCAHDNACHLIGSFYGCLRGVDCYDIHHCQRHVPEPMEDETLSFQTIPVLTAVILSTLVMCCATLCCCAVSFTKDAYEDLVADVTTPLLSSVADENSTVVQDVREAPETSPTNDDEAGDDGQAPQEPIDVEGDDREPVEDDPPSEATAPVASHSVPIHPTRIVRRGPPRAIHRLYNACLGCYIVSLISVGFTSYGIIKYFPQAPENSICNDAVAWNSIVEAMAHRSVAADFQLLASISNPNYMDVAIDMGKGSFYHHANDYIGSFDIPPVTIQARSITDVLINAQFAPEKWQSLSIGAEYYAGTLVLTIDSQVTIRMPDVFNYKFTTGVKGFEVNVNQAADRHLCACPTWSDARTKVPEWMEETLRSETAITGSIE